MLLYKIQGKLGVRYTLNDLYELLEKCKLNPR